MKTLLLFLLLTLRVQAIECAFHGPPRVETRFIPYETRFVVTDYFLEGGKTYSLEVSEDLVHWNSITELSPPTEDTYSPGTAFYVNGYFYPRQFMRLRVVSDMEGEP